MEKSWPELIDGGINDRCLASDSNERLVHTVLGTANRLALVVDRTRFVPGQLARPAPHGEACDVPELVGRSRGAMHPRSIVDALTFMTLQITAQRGRFPCV